MDLKMMALIILLCVFPPVLLLAGEGIHFNRFLLGEVTRINSGLVTLKTDEGIEREFSLNKAQENGVEDLEVGDRLFLQVNKGNLIIDIDRLSEKGVIGKGKDKLGIAGRVVRAEEDRRLLYLRLPNGEDTFYEYESHLADKISQLKKGTLVKLALYEGKDLVHDLEFSR